MLSTILLNVYVQWPESINHLMHGGLQNATVTKHKNLRLRKRGFYLKILGGGRGVVIEVG